MMSCSQTYPVECRFTKKDLHRKFLGKLSFRLDSKSINTNKQLDNIRQQMADQAGGRRSLVNPGTNLRRPPVE